MEAVRLEGLSKSFGAVQAVQNVSLSLRVGEHRGIIGPNGAGKTTLFSLISGELSPTAGRIYLFGRDVTNMAEHRRCRLGLSRSCQMVRLFPEVSVVDNVLLALRAHKLSQFSLFSPAAAHHEMWDKARELLAPWGLWEQRKTRVRELAHGEQRYVELILALASEPRLLLLDEPACGMTPAETEALAKIIRGFGRDITEIIISHDMDLIFGLGLDCITVLHSGMIVTEGSPQEIRDDPRVRDIYLGTVAETKNAATG